MKARLTQAELGKLLGKTQSFVSMIETGRRAIDQHLAAELRELFGPLLTETSTVSSERRWAPPNGQIGLPISVQTWRRSDPSGDSFWCLRLPDRSLFVLAVDVAGHGAEAADQSLYLRGWLSGWVRAFPSVPRLESCVSALTDVLSLLEIDASWFVALISAIGDHEVEYLALAHAMPAPLLMLEDRDVTIPSVAAPGQPPIRHAPLVAPWKLVIASDGLLERLGAGDARRGKQSLLRWQSAASRAQPAREHLGAAGAGVDDETLMILEWGGWDLDLEIEASRDTDVGRALAIVEQWLVPRATPDQASVIENGLIEAIDNARVHAYANGPGVLRMYARAEGNQIRLRVEDRGTWRGAEMPEGLGFRYMRAKADRVDLWRSHPQGATLSLVYTITPPRI